jgi:hypothetical protein
MMASVQEKTRSGSTPIPYRMATGTRARDRYRVFRMRKRVREKTDHDRETQGLDVGGDQDKEGQIAARLS